MAIGRPALCSSDRALVDRLAVAQYQRHGPGEPLLVT